MDIDAFKHDLKRALTKLPPEFVREVMAPIAKNIGALSEIIPGMMEELGPHVRTIAFENAAGILSTQELEKACVEVMGEFQFVLPAQDAAAR